MKLSRGDGLTRTPRLPPSCCSMRVYQVRFDCLAVHSPFNLGILNGYHPLRYFYRLLDSCQNGTGLLNWLRGLDLNQRPMRYERIELPTALPRKIIMLRFLCVGK